MRQSDPENLYGDAYDDFEDEMDRLPPMGPGVAGGVLGETGAIYDMPGPGAASEPPLAQDGAPVQQAKPLVITEGVTPDQLSSWASTTPSGSLNQAMTTGFNF